MAVQPETKRVPGLGVVRLSEFEGKAWGSEVRLGATRYHLTSPTLSDHVRLIERKAQIILAKDASRIVYECGLRSGSRVAEAGVGSGALTLVLANAVAPAGRVFAFDVRPDHLQLGRRNVEKANMAGVVTFVPGDIATSLTERDLDAMALDVPDPERIVNAAWESLRSGGMFACYTPLVVQMETATHALRTRGFLEVRSLETLERGWTVHDRGSRPDTTMLAHTGFLTFARRA